MNIITTVNIRTDLLDKMIYSKQKLNISLNKIVYILLSKALDWNEKSIKIFKSIKYQTKNQDSGWHKLHISLNNALYERCLDMRKLYKLSVSYILAICIQKYLILLSQELDIWQETDNYHDSYIFISNIDKNLFSFTIFWSLPGKSILKKILSNQYS